MAGIAKQEINNQQKICPRSITLPGQVKFLATAQDGVASPLRLVKVASLPKPTWKPYP